MIQVKKDIEVAVRLKNEQSVLEQMHDTLAACGVEVQASHSLHNGHRMLALLITDDGHRAQRVLEAAGFDCWSEAVIRVDAPRRGTAAQLGTQLGAAGVRIVYSYLSLLPSAEGTEFACLVLKTTNDERALAVLQMNSSGLQHPESWVAAGTGAGWGV
jgi:hypothetical protein